MMETMYTHDKNIKFLILALDNQTALKIKHLDLKYVVLVNNSDFFKTYPFLKSQKKLRKFNEFCYLLTPFLMEFCLKNLNKKKIFYVDSDLYFFNDCIKITKKLDKYSIICSVHNFDEKNKFQEKINGKFNVGFVGFKKNYLSLKCLDTWKKQCFFSTTLNESFSSIIRGDQLYLNHWPLKYKKKFSPINNKYFNIGAWNIKNYNFEKKKKYLFANGKKVLMIHVNFIEFDNKNNILISNKFNLKLLNKIICNHYLITSNKIGIKNSKIISKSFKSRLTNFIYRIF